MAKPLGFKDFLTVDYKPEEDEQISYNAKQRKAHDEALDFRQRRARAISMKKNKAKIAMGRRRAAKKAPSKETILKRARRQAIKTIFKKLSKNVPKSELPPSRRQEIEKRLGKMKVKIDRLAKRSVKDVRKREKERKMQRAG